MVDVMPTHVSPALHDAIAEVVSSVRQHGWPRPPHATQVKVAGSHTLLSKHRAIMGEGQESTQHGSVSWPQVLVATEPVNENETVGIRI